MNENEMYFLYLNVKAYNQFHQAVQVLEEVGNICYKLTLSKRCCLYF